jgi:formylglycine-generating enzyme required for sulfatase activity
MEFVLVKGGCYQMGDTLGSDPGKGSEEPVHEACVSDFYIATHEVTVGDFKKFVKETGYTTEAEKSGGCGVWKGSKWVYAVSNNWRNADFPQTDRQPVVCVSWNDAMAYTTWQAGKTRRPVRLPTEAEWEYAARSGGANDKYSGTSSEGTLGEYAWYYANSFSQTHATGLKKPNGLGLYDMTGNVWEWMTDGYEVKYYQESPIDNPAGAYGAQRRSARGGSWLVDPRSMGVSYRTWFAPGTVNNSLGFRVLFPAR